MKGKTDEWDHVRLSSFNVAKKTRIKANRQPTGREEACASYATGRGLTPRASKELNKFNNKHEEA